MLCDIGNGAMNILRYWQLHDFASEYTKFSYPYGAMHFMANSCTA
jgi:hypothetical protein